MKPPTLRTIRLSALAAGATVLDEPSIRGLMALALTVAGVDLKMGRGQVEFSSTLASQAVRR